MRKVVVDGSHVKNPEALAAIAATVSGHCRRRTLLKELQTRSKYKVLLPDLERRKGLGTAAEPWKRSHCAGIYFHQNTTRTYPNGPLLSHVLGFLARKDPKDENVVGVEGIERSMEYYLRGIDGFRHIERDRPGREIVIYRGQEQAPRHGMNVQLTIDMGIQAILEAELDNAFRELRPDNATGVMRGSETGEILAMTSRPTFDLNQINAAKHEEMKNRAIFDMVEPGSTFKIVVASARSH